MESPSEPRSNSGTSFPPQVAADNRNQGADNKSQSSVDVDDQPPPLTRDPICLYQNFSLPSRAVKNLQYRSETQPFQAEETDILFVSKPKSGTTWLKALIFTIIYRDEYPVVVNPGDPSAGNNRHPLFSANPHALVTSLEFHFLDPRTTLEEINKCAPPPSRLYSTHLPYPVLPESIRTSGCKIVYLCRNPLDTVVSWWCFGSHKGETEEESSRRLEEAVDALCNGVEAFGPHWDHVLGYLNQSFERPDKVLFMRFEEMKEDQISGIKKLAEFVGYPLTEKEEEEGVVEGIAQLCSFGSLKNLEVNQSGKDVSNSKFFRKGKVGDWVNHLSPSMANRVKKVMQHKFEGTGLDTE